MTSQHPIDLDLAFARRDCPMIADLMEQLSADPSLTPTRARDMLSGLRRIAHALGRDPQNVPADPAWLQKRLTQVAPAALGISRKSWQNALSDARAAMAHCGIVERRRHRPTDLSPRWKALWQRVRDRNDQSVQLAIARFIYFLDRHGIGPDEVDDTAAQLYRDALVCNEISKSPDVAWRAAVNGWNLAGARIEGWPQRKLSLSSRQVVFRPDDGTLPQSFHDDLTRFLDRLATPDPLGETWQSKVIRPATRKQYKCQILRLAGDVIAAGTAAHDLTDLCALLTPLRVEAGLRQMLARHDKQTGRGIYETARLASNFARRLGLPAEDQKKLDRLSQRLAVKPQHGMTRKNRERLRPLQNDRRLRDLLQLPDRLFKRGQIGSGKRYYDALACEDALAIAILLVCPIRVKNLASIHLERNIERPGDGRVYLCFAEEETKTGSALEFELPADLIRMIDRHLKTRSEVLCPLGTPWLFPRRDGSAPCDETQLGSRIKKRVLREIGLTVNAHLFRHIAVMTWLDANPGAYEAARRLLGHSSVSHTINLYSGLETKTATKAFSDLMSQKKGRRK